MPRIVFGVNFVEDQSVVDNERSKALLSLAVIKSSSVLSNFIEEGLPAVDVITQSLINLLCVDDPQGFVVEPYLQVVLCVLENIEDLAVGALKHLWVYLEKHILIVLFPLIFLYQRALILVGFQSG